MPHQQDTYAKGSGQPSCKMGEDRSTNSGSPTGITTEGTTEEMERNQGPEHSAKKKKTAMKFLKIFGCFLIALGISMLVDFKIRLTVVDDDGSSTSTIYTVL